MDKDVVKIYPLEAAQIALGYLFDVVNGRGNAPQDRINAAEALAATCLNLETHDLLRDMEVSFPIERWLGEHGGVTVIPD